MLFLFDDFIDSGMFFTKCFYMRFQAHTVHSSELKKNCTLIAPFVDTFVTEKIGASGLSLYLLTLSIYTNI